MQARRNFLALILSGFSLLLLGDSGILLGRWRERRRGMPLALLLARLFRNPRSARSIGAEYLRCHHPGRDAAALLPLIAKSGLLEGRLTREALGARARHDFAEGRVVHVRGWILSETEAHLCALTVLLPVGAVERSPCVG